MNKWNACGIYGLREYRRGEREREYRRIAVDRTGEREYRRVALDRTGEREYRRVALDRMGERCRGGGEPRRLFSIAKSTRTFIPSTVESATLSRAWNLSCA